MQTRVHRRNLVYGLIAAAGLCQFVVAVAIAIVNYPETYSLSRNFLSDLGCRVTPEGSDNRVSSVVFNRSIICLGASLLPFFIVMPSSLAELRRTMQALGAFSAAGLVGIGATPYDQYCDAHLVALGIWLGPLALTVPAYLFVTLRSGEASLLVCAGGATLLGMSALYVLVGGSNVVMAVQKLVVASAICWFLLVFAGVSVETYRAISTRQEIADRQARKYLAMMGNRLPRRRR